MLESIVASGGVLCGGGGGFAPALGDWPMANKLLNKNSIKVNMFTIWGRIVGLKVIIFFEQQTKNNFINRLITRNLEK